MPRGNGGPMYEINWLQEVAEGFWGGNLGIETRWMQEIVEGNRGGIFDIEIRWTKKFVERPGPGGSVDIQTIWAQRYWAQMTMHARSCRETRGRNLDIETAWAQEVAERHRCVRALEYWNKMLARNCGEATGVPHVKPNECRKLLRGTRGKFWY